MSVKAKQQVRAEVMRVNRERQIEVERRAAEEKAAWIEAEKQFAAMNM